jgi:hypothetical protein
MLQIINSLSINTSPCHIHHPHPQPFSLKGEGSLNVLIEGYSNSPTRPLQLFRCITQVARLSSLLPRGRRAGDEGGGSGIELSKLSTLLKTEKKILCQQT